MCSPMPDGLDAGDDAPPPCARYPECEAPVNHPLKGAVHPCTWPECTEDERTPAQRRYDDFLANRNRSKEC